MRLIGSPKHPRAMLLLIEHKPGKSKKRRQIKLYDMSQALIFKGGPRRRMRRPGPFGEAPKLILSFRKISSSTKKKQRKAKA